MPAASLLPPEEWEALKIANIRGIPDDQLSTQFGVPRGTIRLRRMRDKAWSAAMIGNPVSETKAAAIVTANETKAKTAAILGEMGSFLQDAHARTAVALVKASEKALSKFAKAAPTPETWTDAKTAYTIQRLAAGIDKEGTNVNLSVSMFSEQAGGSEAEGVTWEVDGQILSTGDSQE